MKNWKIANEEGMTFAYREPRENEKTCWQLGGKPVVPVSVPDPADNNCEDDLSYWSFSLDDEDLEFSIQYYYDRWNFSDDSCRRDKDIVDALVTERDNRKTRTAGGGGYATSAYAANGYASGGAVIINAGSGSPGAGAGGAITITAGVGSSGGKFVFGQNPPAKKRK